MLTHGQRKYVLTNFTFNHGLRGHVRHFHTEQRHDNDTYYYIMRLSRWVSPRQQRYGTRSHKSRG